MIDLKEVITKYPECLESAAKFRSYMLDLYPAPMDCALIRALSDMLSCGIVDDIRDGKTDKLAVSHYVATMKQRYGYSSRIISESISQWIEAFGGTASFGVATLQEKTNLNTEKNEVICSPKQDNQISLTPTQTRAVKSDSKRIAVIAGPGSGKTRVLTERIIHLIQVKGVSEGQILALSFSSKAAKEVKRRLNDRLGMASYRIETKTLHSFGLQVIRNHYDLLGLNEEFEILNSTGKNKYLRQILKSNYISENEIGVYSQEISKIKNGESSDQKIVRIASIYNDMIGKANCIDFDDMIFLSVKILKENPAIQKNYQEMYAHILVDEVQDLNAKQEELLELILGANSSLFIVGDDDQCIYEWRGSKPDYLKGMANNGSVEVIKLEENFRSDKAIVDVSSSLISNNQNRIGKWMQAKKFKRAANQVKSINPNATRAFRFCNQEEEARFIASEIQKLMSENYKCNDIAILVRSVKQAPTIMEELARQGIPCFEQLSDVSAYDELIPVLRSIPHIKAKNSINRAINYPVMVMDNYLFSELREKFCLDTSLPIYESFEILATNGEDFDDCEVFRSRFSLLNGLNDKYKNMSASEILTEMYSQYAIEPLAKMKKAQEKLAHLKALIEIAEDFDNVYDPNKSRKSQLEDFIDYLMLSAQDDSTDDMDREGVNLMTCHKSKGLEFPVVFIPDVQVGIFPNDFFISSKEELEAERRLFYVSMTRAIDRLYVTSSEDPFIGKGLIKKGFMAEIPGVTINI